MPNGKRVTLYLSLPVNDNLTVISRRMGISKSVLVDKLLEPATTQLHDLLHQLPENPSKGDIVRFRGRSIQLVETAVSEMRDVLKEV